MTRLAVLDLVPVSSGSDARTALANSLDLVRVAERAGYDRYWFAEHHLNPGVAGTSPAVLVALAGAASSRIRLGAGALQMGHRTALSSVEEFGLLDTAFPGRIDLGLGRSAGRVPSDVTAPALVGAGGPQHSGSYVHETGLRIPAPVSLKHLAASPRAALQHRLLQLPGAQSEDYGEQVDDVLALLRGEYVSDDGVGADAVPGTGAGVQVWVFGSSGGQSAQAAGRNGLRFAANYHVSPAGVLDAADGYRAAFVPSAELNRPYVSVSADVVVADDEGHARELATGYGLWVHSIRSGAGAIEFPTPQQATAHQWTDEQRALVADRVETQFVGNPSQVADGLERLRDATGADELVITTITHEHAERVRSYELLAEEWSKR